MDRNYGSTSVICMAHISQQGAAHPRNWTRSARLLIEIIHHLCFIGNYFCYKVIGCVSTYFPNDVMEQWSYLPKMVLCWVMIVFTPSCPTFIWNAVFIFITGESVIITVLLFLLVIVVVKVKVHFTVSSVADIQNSFIRILVHGASWIN